MNEYEVTFDLWEETLSALLADGRVSKMGMWFYYSGDDICKELERLDLVVYDENLDTYRRAPGEEVVKTIRAMLATRRI